MFKNLKIIENCKLKIEDLLKCGFYLFIFFLPWQVKLILRPGWTNHGAWDYGTISLYGSHLFLLGLLALFAVRYLRRPKEAREPAALKKEWLWMILSGLDLLLFISIVFAPDTTLAVYRYILFLLGIGLFWLVVKIDFSKKGILIAFLAALFVQSALAIWQFLTQYSPASKWLGLAEHAASSPGVSAIETVGASGIGERWLRAYGSLDHPNILGGLLAFGAAAIILAIIKHRRSGQKTDWAIIIYYLSFTIVFVALLFSFSRSAWLALAAGWALIFLFGVARKNWLAVKRLLGLGLFSLAVFGAIFFNYQNLFSTRAGSAARLEMKSISERQMYLKDSYEMISKHWLFGAGIGNYTARLAKDKPQQPFYYIQPVHNVWLLVLAESGIFGLLFFAGFFVYLFAASLKSRAWENLPFLLMLVIIMSFDHYLWSLPFGVLFFWLIAGFLVKNILDKRPGSERLNNLNQPTAYEKK